MGQINTSLGIADVKLEPRSKETGFSSVPFEFKTTTASTIIWEALDENEKRIPDIYGTVVAIGTAIAGTTRIAVNGVNTTQINDNDTFSETSDPLRYILITYTSANSKRSSLSVSLSTVKFQY